MVKVNKSQKALKGVAIIFKPLSNCLKLLFVFTFQNPGCPRRLFCGSLFREVIKSNVSLTVIQGQGFIAVEVSEALAINKGFSNTVNKPLNALTSLQCNSKSNTKTKCLMLWFIKFLISFVYCCNSSS